jgi:hypothetical protein
MTTINKTYMNETTTYLQCRTNYSKFVYGLTCCNFAYKYSSSGDNIGGNCIPYCNGTKCDLSYIDKNCKVSCLKSVSYCCCCCFMCSLECYTNCCRAILKPEVTPPISNEIVRN